jgi:DNA primase
VGDEREQIRERLPIETLVGEHVVLKRAGQVLKGLCPFHKEKTPSFVVYPQDGRCHCFGCGSGGDVFRFYMLINKVEFPEALRALAARTGVELDPDAAKKKATEARAHEVLAAVTLYFQQSLAGEAGRVAREYLARRGIGRETIERFALGYMPDWGEGLRRELPVRGVSEQELLDAAVLIPSDQGREPFSPFHGRLIFPIRDMQGRITGFGGRILGEGQPKYLNSRQTATFDKSSTLYTIDRAAEAIRQSGEAVIVEGYMDALRAHQDGFANVVASLGTAITPRQLALLGKLRGRDGAPLRVVLALDADPAGARAAAEAGLRATIALRQTRPDPGTLTLGRSNRPPLELFIATLPEGRDPDEVIAADPAQWRAVIAGAAPAMDYLFELILRSLNRASPTFSQDAVAALLPLIGELPGVGLQQPYLERLAAVTRIDTAALRGDLARLRGEARRNTRQSAPRRSELAALQERAAARDPRSLVEEELLSFLLRQCPLSAASLDRLAGAPLSTTPRQRLLEAIVAAHAGGAKPRASAIVASLESEAGALGEALLAAPVLPLLEPPKVPTAINQFLLRLERLIQGERLQAQADLLDQLDAETAGDLLRPTQDLVARRHDLSRRMLEEQATYHLR